VVSCHAGPFNGPSGTSHDRHGREVALYVFGGAGGLLVLAWFAMTGRRFLRLEA
jgi:hypothetical protein